MGKPNPLRLSAERQLHEARLSDKRQTKDGLTKEEAAAALVRLAVASLLIIALAVWAFWGRV